eukprot:1641254-Rhodomonas_salina.1
MHRTPGTQGTSVLRGCCVHNRVYWGVQAAARRALPCPAHPSTLAAKITAASLSPVQIFDDLYLAHLCQPLSSRVA